MLLWIEEKFEIAEDESYRDPTNILRKLKKHEAAEKEMQANHVRIDRLTEVQHYITCIVYYFSSNISTLPWFRSILMCD